MSNGQRLILGPFFYLGDLLTDGKLYHYASGTTTLKDVYTDRAQTTTADQPLPSDANGLFTAYGSGLYKFVLKDVNDTEISIFDETEVQIPITGTWTPVLSFGGASVGITYTTQTGSYIQDGELVHVRIVIVLTSKGSSTGSAQVTLPLTSGSGNPAGALFATSASGLTGLTTEIHGSIGSSTTAIVLEDWISTGRDLITDANFGNSSNFLLVGWYRAA